MKVYKIYAKKIDIKVAEPQTLLYVDTASALGTGRN